MNMPEWFKPGAYGAIFGAAMLAVIGFNWGGWQTATGAEKRAAIQSSADVTAALVPVCLERSRNDPASVAKLESLRAAAPSGQPDLLMKTGWATPPGGDKADRSLARACLQAMAVATQ